MNDKYLEEFICTINNNVLPLKLFRLINLLVEAS